jgi:hypothetical protein
VGEKAADVDRRLVELSYYSERNVEDDSEEIEFMNAKCLAKLAQTVAQLENNNSITKDQFILVEDNYHSFITRDPLNAFFLSPYQSSNKAEISNIPGTPGYSPRLVQSSPSDGEDEEEDIDKYESRGGGKSPALTTAFSERRRRNISMHNWLQYDDDTLDKLKKFIEAHPEYTAEQYTRGWNSIYSATP